jgi:acyl dehydratase
MSDKIQEKEKQDNFEEQRDSAEGKITPEGLASMRRRIGMVQPASRYAEPSPMPGHEYASVDGIRGYSEGIGDPNPLYRDPEYAAKTRWGKLIAHPTFILYMGVPLKKELTAEERAKGKAGGLSGVHAMYGGDELEWFRPIEEGDRLTCKCGLAKVEEKPSKTAGFAVHETGEVVLWNQRGELVGIRRSKIIRYERTASRERRTHLEVQPAQYTPEDMSKIDADYDKEERRGANPRYWEDVTIGEEIVPVVKGPWRVEQPTRLQSSW